MNAPDLISLNTHELKDFLKHIIENNRYLQTQNKLPVSVEVIGESGIGKTSTILQLANELDLDLVKLNLSQIEEIGDLVGFPIRQFKVTNTKETLWIDENSFDEYIKMGYSSTGENRTSYCPPEWISDKKKGGILLLDDWNRADMRFIQALMELIDRQQYISWKLPKDWHIVLTSNPEGEDYLVNSIDSAQKTRFIRIQLKFDSDCWAEWAEGHGLDTRCINFLLLNPELVNTKTNSRSISMFFNSISSLPNFNKSLPLIQMVGEGSVGPEFSNMFTLFINNKLDKLISPDNIFEQNEKYVLGALNSAIGEKEEYRADIASVISTRIINHLKVFSKTNPIEKGITDRISTLINKEVFSPDISYNLVKSIYNNNPTKFKHMLSDPNMIKYIME